MMKVFNPILHEGGAICSPM